MFRPLLCARGAAGIGSRTRRTRYIEIPYSASRSTVADRSESRWVLIAALGVGMRAAGDRVAGRLLVLDGPAMSLYGRFISQQIVRGTKRGRKCLVRMSSAARISRTTPRWADQGRAKSAMSACGYNATRRGKLSYLLKARAKSEVLGHLAWGVRTTVTARQIGTSWDVVRTSIRRSRATSGE